MGVCVWGGGEGGGGAIFVRSTIMKESLRCEGRGGLRDLILHSDSGVRLQHNATALSTYRSSAHRSGL